jgi:hypothetical protein
MKLTQRFGPIPLTTTLDGSGNGTVTFQSNGANARVTNLFVKVSTTTAQATCVIYKGQVADGNTVNSTNSGSTGATASGAIDLTDGETLYVRWTGGDAGATATATFTGITLPFDQIGPSQLAWADPIAAGDGSLVYPALKSPNYVPLTTGWELARDGSADLGLATVRGSLIVNGPSGSYAAVDDTDGFPSLRLLPSAFADAGVQATSIEGVITAAKNEPGTATDDTSYLILRSPAVGATPRQATVYMQSATFDDAGDPQIIAFSDGGGNVSFYIDGSLFVTNKLTVGGVGQRTYVAMSAIQNFTNTITPANVSGMSFTAVANATYLIQARFAVGGPTAADVRLSWSVPAGAVMNRNILAAAAGVADNASTSMVNIRRGAATQQVAGTSGGVSNDFTGWWEDTQLIMGASAGTVQLQGAQGTLNATPTVFQASSYFTVERVD